MTTLELKQKKTELRKEFRQKRNAIPDEVKAELSARIAQNVINSVSFRFADAVLLYNPCRGEVDTQEIFLEAKRRGKVCAYPRTYDGGRMKFFVVSEETDFEKGRFGLYEPKETLPELEVTLHPLCIVPALSFDGNGFRLGYGGGYYDRFLPKFCGISVGVQYDALISEELPRDKRHDKRVDIVATEKGLVVIG